MSVSTPPTSIPFVSTTVMQGGGEYNRYSSLQRTAAAGAIAILPTAIAALSPHLPTSGEAITVLDYGCSEGKNSVLHVEAIVEQLRKAVGGLAGSPRPISLILNDQPANDWGSLVRTFSTEGLLTRHRSVFLTLAPTSFFQQVVPDRTVHLGWSSIATHWLSKPPSVHLSTAVYSYASTIPEESRVWADEAAKDWHEFLADRSRELVPGGVLLLCMLMVDPSHPDNPPVGDAEPIFRLMKRFIQDHYPHTSRKPGNAHLYFRTAEETCSSSVLRPHNLKLLHCHVSVQKEGPFRRAYRQHGNKQLLAEQSTGMLRAVAYENIKANQGEEFAAKFFELLPKYIEDDPECYDFNIPVGTVLLQKDA